MGTNKTVENDHSVKAFLDQIEHPQRKKDALLALDLMTEITKLEPKMWGNSIVGFGKYQYNYDSGREGEFFRVGFSPRKTSMTFYIMARFPEYENLLSKLGKHKLGKSCLYINKLDDVNIETLQDIIMKSFYEMNSKYPSAGE